MRKPNKRVAVLISGGMDSVTMYYLLQRKGYETLPIYIDYGQRVMVSEMRTLTALGITPTVFECKMEDVYINRFRGLKPLRNLMFVVKTAAWAYLNRTPYLAVGCTKGDGALIPDMDGEFFAKVSDVLTVGLAKKMTILTPLANKTKTEIMLLANKIGLDIRRTWSCFLPGKEQCGKCKSCKRMLNAIEEAQQIKRKVKEYA